jgi:hypothetical protein
MLTNLSLGHANPVRLGDEPSGPDPHLMQGVLGVGIAAGGSAL